MSASIILCADEKEQTEKRNKYKRFAKDNGTFLKVERNTVVLTGGDSVSFVVEDAPKMEEEPVLYGGCKGGGMSKAVGIQVRKYAPLEKVDLPLSDDTKILADEHGYYAEPDGSSVPKMDVETVYDHWDDLPRYVRMLRERGENEAADRICKTVQDMME